MSNFHNTIRVDELVNDLIKHDEEQFNKHIELTEQQVRQRSQQTDHELLTEHDGFIEMRNGELFIRSPKENGRQPILCPHPKLELYLNGKIITSNTFVKERDQISLKVKQGESFQVTVSSDQLEVYLTILPEAFLTYELKDKRRSLQFTFDVKKKKHDVNIEQFSSLIIEEVFKRGIQCDINTTAILDEIKSPTFQPVIIAEGLPIIESRDAYIDTFFQTKIEVSYEDINGKIDFKNRLKIPNVKTGDVIAKVHEPLEGRDGLTVYGKTLAAKPPKNIEVRSKKRVEITKDGRAIALYPGRPTITGNVIKYFDITKTHEIRGDVDIKTGNVHFNGDVIIHGDIKEDMQVEALGNIYISGHVYSARVISSQSIYIAGTTINSTIIAGQHGILMNEVYKLIQDFHFQFTQLLKATDMILEQIKAQDITYTIGQVIATLVEQKFHMIPDTLKTFDTLITEAKKQGIDTPVHLIILKRSLHHFSGYHQMNAIQSKQVIENIIFSLDEVIHQMESSITTESDIVLHQADMSTIKTNGTIRVTGRGTLNSNLFAGRTIAYEKEDSSIRGGKIESVGSITAGVIGTDTGSTPELIAGEEIKMKQLNQAHIKIKNSTKSLYEQRTNVTFSYESATKSIISYTTEGES
ncbi:DUF342 domain-containing protein [Desertibacillus haloalkaliphilus]|uniref:DUF342 domain-containing protein n=1 Tax=Desertibacillus haloalkaliphilus TaxID=1328930 RepID=UPI001C255447|nr:FapA family protein [Desertibacillus haloalkaliphilus]MBU8906418.1 FapA family protein [Desertibacillus haloalkaliphilus]